MILIMMRIIRKWKKRGILFSRLMVATVDDENDERKKKEGFNFQERYETDEENYKRKRRKDIIFKMMMKLTRGKKRAILFSH